MSTEEDKKAIAETLARFGEALNRGDYDSVLDQIADDAVFWPANAAETRGRQTLRSAYDALAGYTVHASFDIEEILVSGDLAVVRAYENFRLDPKAGGPPVEIKRRRAFSIQRREPDGSWKTIRGMTGDGPRL
jgi:ketosteroid isomerase-like protein